MKKYILILIVILILLTACNSDTTIVDDGCEISQPCK